MNGYIDGFNGGLIDPLPVSSKVVPIFRFPRGVGDTPLFLSSGGMSPPLAALLPLRSGEGEGTRPLPVSLLTDLSLLVKGPGEVWRAGGGAGAASEVPYRPVTGSEFR